MTTTMKGFRCWSSASVGQTVYSDIGALPSDADAVFLAAHTPMSLSHVKGPEISSTAFGERNVLGALLSGVGDIDRNTLVAVTGASGTGKSHVVRWVHAHLNANDPRFHVLYVPRAVQTIRELLRRLVGELPGDLGSEFLARIDDAVGRSTPAEFADRLLEEMRLSLTWTLEVRPAVGVETSDERSDREERNTLLGEPDETGKRRDGLADLMSLAGINRALLRPGGRIDRLVSSVFEETSRRDEQQEQFEPTDLPLRETGVWRAIGSNESLRGLWDVVRQEPKATLDLLDEALRAALPRTLGIRGQTGETLDSLFRHSRQMLREQGRELILLFEDLAQFGLVDGELYDQFVTPPGEDLAALRVLFAVTDGPFGKLQQTVQTRITHRFVVGSTALADGDQFVARYLNLVRVGRNEIQAAWSRSRDSHPDAWVPNACDTRAEGLPCPVRDECHSGFGAIDVTGIGRVGLYPYNHIALRRALTQNAETRTARNILDVCLTEELDEADPHIADGTYPHERVRNRVNFRVSRTKDSLLNGQEGDEADRLYRALVIWGDEKPLPLPIVEAFSLNASSAAEPGSILQEDRQPLADHRRVTPNQDLPNPLQSLFQWTTDDHLPDDDADYYRGILHRLVSDRLGLDQDLFHTANGNGNLIMTRLFNTTSFNFGEDTRGRLAGAQSVRFRIQRDEPDDVRVLMAARWFSDHGHWAPTAGAWRWPDGYEPVELMLALETRLESWADVVRRAYRDRVRGRDLANAAIGLRAVALMAAGVDPASIQQLGHVLRSAPAAATPNPAWFEADRTARAVLPRVQATEWVGQFAAARQGEGQRTLIDVVELDAALAAVLTSPTAFLAGVASDLRAEAPELAECAQRLLADIEASAAGSLAQTSDALVALESGLAGQRPKAVAAAAREVGRLAKDESLYRSMVSWLDFSDALETVKHTPTTIPLAWRTADVQNSADDAVTTQHWARHAVASGLALGMVMTALADTTRECKGRLTSAGDLGKRKKSLAGRLALLESRVKALSDAEVGT